MPRLCTVCTHPEREIIDQEVVSGMANTAVASLFGVSEEAIRRHKRNHLPGHLLKAQEAEEQADAGNLLYQLKDLQRRTLTILRANEALQEDHAIALRAIAEARRNLELLARLTEMLGPETEINVSVGIDARVQGVILDALAPYPEARVAAAAALVELDGE